MYIRNNTYELRRSSSEDCFEVDDLIAPAISVLNQKGYRTAFCCSGHADRHHSPEIAYIAFEFGGLTPEYLPDGWIWVHDGQMEYVYETASPETIAAVMSALLVWAEALPDATI